MGVFSIINSKQCQINHHKQFSFLEVFFSLSKCVSIKVNNIFLQNKSTSLHNQLFTCIYISYLQMIAFVKVYISSMRNNTRQGLNLNRILHSNQPTNSQKSCIGTFIQIELEILRKKSFLCNNLSLTKDYDILHVDLNNNSIEQINIIILTRINMNDSSLLSQDGKNKQSISLQQDLQDSQAIQWRNEQINFNLQRSDCFDEMEQTDQRQQEIGTQQKQKQKPTETSDFSVSNDNFQQTIQFGQMEGDTIFGQNSLLNYTGPNSSGSTQSYGQTSMYKQFQAADLKIYRVHIESINSLYQKVRQYSEKSLENFKMYFSFFKVKQEQHQHYLQNKQIQQFQFLQKKLESNDAYRQAFMNSKLAIDLIILKKRKRLRSSQQVLFTIKRCKEILENAIKQIINSRKVQQSQIENIQQKINSLYKQISMMIIDRIGRQSLAEDLDNSVMAPIQNAQIMQRDRYLESKYLTQCEKKYLQNINQVTGIVIKYVNNVLNEQEIVMCTTIKDCLEQYCIIKKSEQQKNELELSVDTKLKLLLEQDLLGHALQNNRVMLLRFLTGNLQSQSYKKAGLKLSDVISMLNKDLQEIIYLPVLDIPEKLIKAKFTQIVWTPSKQIISAPVGANFQPIEVKKDKSNKYKINLVLSIDGFLHFQQNTSVLTYHLKDLKLQKKMNVFNVIDKGKGMLGYFMRKTDVGKIDLKTDQDAEEFINNMNDIMIKFS